MTVTRAEAELSMIQVRDVSKRFGKLVAVAGLSFEVKEGEAVALWGENGAGKTTALRCLLGVIPFEGSVSLSGFESKSQGKQARMQIGFVPQEINFHDDLSVIETLEFYAKLKHLAEETGYHSRMIERLGLSSTIDRHVRDLSGGMKQRLALAIALLADPPILILDEPTANLDVRARDEFLLLLKELKQSGKTLVFSSHRQEEVKELADRVLIIENGEIVADCLPEELESSIDTTALLKLYLPDKAWITPAIDALARSGYSAEQNGTGIWVRVTPMEKAKPISLLVEAGIPVDDFQIE